MADEAVALRLELVELQEAADSHIYDLEDRLVRMAQAVDVATARWKEALSLNDTLRLENFELRQRIGDSTPRAASDEALLAEVRQLRDQCAALTEELEQRADEAVDTDKRMRRFEQHMLAEQLRASELEQELVRVQTEADQLVRAQDAKLMQYQAQLSAARDEQAEETDLRRVVAAEANALEQRVLDLSAKSQELTAVRDELQQQLRERDAACQDLQAQVGFLEAERTNLMHAAQAAQSETQAISKDISLYREQAMQLAGELQACKAELTRLHGLLSQWRSTAPQLMTRMVEYCLARQEIESLERMEWHHLQVLLRSGQRRLRLCAEPEQEHPPGVFVATGITGLTSKAFLRSVTSPIQFREAGKAQLPAYPQRATSPQRSPLYSRSQQASSINALHSRSSPYHVHAQLQPRTISPPRAADGRKWVKYF